jgi:hypothetical protein
MNKYSTSAFFSFRQVCYASHAAGVLKRCDAAIATNNTEFHAIPHGQNYRYH